MSTSEELLFLKFAYDMFLFLVVLSSFTCMNDCRLGGLLLEEKGGKHVQPWLSPVMAKYVPFP